MGNRKARLRCPACGQFASLEKAHICPTVIILSRKLAAAKQKSLQYDLADLEVSGRALVSAIVSAIASQTKAGP